MNQEMLTEIVERLTRIEETGRHTFEQTTKTNGRVSGVEERVTGLEKRESNLMGKITIVTSIAGIIITGVIALMWDGIKRIIYGNGS